MDFAPISAHYLTESKLIDLRAAKCGIAAIVKMYGVVAAMNKVTQFQNTKKD